MRDSKLEAGDAEARLAWNRRVQAINVDPILPALLAAVGAPDATSTEVVASRVMELLTQHFTAVQLEALTRFHESSQGQAILRKHLQARQTEKPPEDASDLPGARTEAARRFMTTFQMERFFGGMTRRQMPRSEDSPESVSKWIHAWYEQVFAPLEFEREVHVYTRRELDALTEFFRSGDGRTSRPERDRSSET